MESYSHTITECLGLEGTSKIIQFQPPCSGQGPGGSKPHPLWPWTLPGMMYPPLLWATCASLTALMVTSNLNLPSIQFKAIFPCPVTTTCLVKSHLVKSQLSCSPFRYCKVLKGVPGAFPSLGWTTPALSASLHRQLFDHINDLPLEPLRRSTSFLCWRPQRWAQYQKVLHLVI